MVKREEAHADFENCIKRLNNIAQSDEQAAVLEEELARVRKAAKELADLLKQDIL